ncbi:SGNH/GDSL hydrolase family protein [Gordonia jinhuaensis]|uniref:SGNH hydrolase-type esterase domain-containing protein n=1 Tax=Gordonia jinhuaensis TaxID=1517702 RepID=A0A916WN27_9ACTN|nr:SGNH/GDSL hydrolase family protein [Gordonia jinhuaensis]GGB18002.1 hypothetical protein GCM10011489_02620 [Gordonia jinhuaensis]
MLGSSRRLATTAAAATAAAAGTAGAGWGAYALLTGQARQARTVIPHRTDNAPDGDGVYAADGLGPARPTHSDPADIHLMIFGDSTAAGLGAEVADETPGVVLARMLAEATGKRVQMSNKAIVGATSRGLASQVDATLITGRTPDVAVILIGANDVTDVHRIGPSARLLGEAVRRLVDAGSSVVVGTCPDLGVISAVPQPLRYVIRRYGLRLATAQSHAVRRNGGRPVPLADLLADEFYRRPEALLSPDNFHPSADGYRLAAETLLPEVLASIGEWHDGELPRPPVTSEFLHDGGSARRAREQFSRAPHQ